MELVELTMTFSNIEIIHLSVIPCSQCEGLQQGQQHYESERLLLPHAHPGGSCSAKSMTRPNQPGFIRQKTWNHSVGFTWDDMGCELVLYE